MLHKKTKLGKRIQSLLLCLCMVLSCLPVSVFATGETETACTETDCNGHYENGFCTANSAHCQAAVKNADGYYEIGNAGQLYWFKARTCHISESSGNCAKLTDDIVVNPGTFDENGNYIPKNGETAREWVPIGNANYGYIGTFDGNGKTISGLYYNSDANMYVGLFGCVNDGATLKDVGIINSCFYASNSYYGICIGALAGYVDLSNSDLTISNCYSEGCRIVTADNRKDNRIGGLFGRIDIDNANVTISGCYSADNSLKGQSTTYDSDSAGGLIGYVYGSDGGKLIVKQCYNTSAIEVNIGCAGGLIGTTYAKKALNVEISDCYSTGLVTGNTKSKVGAVLGYNNDEVSTTTTNCYYLTDTASKGVGNGTDTTTAKTADEFASGAVAWLLNGEKADGVWKQNLVGDKKMSLPGFTGEAVNYDATNNTYYNTHNYVGGICTDCGAQCPHDTYENGFCADCGGYQAAVLAGGYYEIGNLGNLYWFADKVNGGDNAINAKLTADIDVTAKSDFAIGTKDNPFGGVFDGNGHTLTVNIASTEEAAAPFSYAGGATFKNLTIAGTVATSAKYAGGFVGSTTGSLTFEKCLSLVTINSTLVGDGTHGGFVGVANSGDGVKLVMKNCGFAGAINGEKTTSCGGLAGWLNAPLLVTDSFVAATYTVSGENGNSVARNDKNLTLKNVYYLNMLGGAPSGAIAITADQLTSGELTYKLGSAWKQTLGTDKFPNFSGKTVYGDGFDCTGKPGAYNNIGAGAVPAHKLVNGVCSECGGYEEPTLNSDGYYEIGNAGELEWFSAYVNNGHGNTNAILTADIDLTGITHTPIGVNYSDFAGMFDGKGHTIRNMNFTCAQNGYGGNLTYDYQGLFGVIVDGATVKNFTVYGEIVLAADGQKYIGGAVGLAYSGAKIENVASYVNITDNKGEGEKGFSNISQIGGVVGQLGNTRNNGTSATAQNCRYYGKIDVNTAASVGGIAGQGVKNSLVQNCVNYGTVGWNYIGHAAGVIGSAQSGTQVKRCVNYGSVSIVRNDCVGGVVGYANENVYIENCANYADIEARKSDVEGEPNVYLGGILGYVNNGSFGGLTGCFNYGKVTDLDGAYTYTGAIVGYVNNATNADVIKNNAYLDTSCSKAYGTIGSSAQPEDATSATAAQFASGEIAYLLNGGVTDGTQGWYQELTDKAKLDKYPVLSGKTVYKYTDCKGNENYANTAFSEGSHNYDGNGFCLVCDGYQEALLNSDGYYEIGNAGQLYWFAEKVNGGDTGINGKLTADIIVNPGTFSPTTGEYTPKNNETIRSWIPIGKAKSYFGIFDGNGKTVSGLYCKSDEYMAIGLFGFIYAGASIRNTGVVNSAFFSLHSTRRPCVGGLVGSAETQYEKISITDCFSSAYINSKSSEMSYVGGLLGYAYAWNGHDITISNCYSTGNIVENMTGSSSVLVGGLVGYAWSYDSKIEISACYNSGDVKSSAPNGYESNVGGFVGYCGGEGSVIIKNCYNTGNVKADGRYVYSSGVVSYIETNTTLIQNCYSTGSIAATGSKKLSIGGVIGNNAGGGTIENCYYLTGTASMGIGTGTGTTTAKTDDEFASGEVAYLLQKGVSAVTTTDDEGNEITTIPLVWGQKSSTDGSAPILTSNEDFRVLPVMDGEAVVNYSVLHMGDVDRSGEVDIYDLQQLVNIALSESNTRTETEKYDLNGDGVFDVLDCTIAQNEGMSADAYDILTKKALASEPAYREKADFDGDGVVDVLDASTLERLLSGHRVRI